MEEWSNGSMEYIGVAYLKKIIFQYSSIPTFQQKESI